MESRILQKKKNLQYFFNIWRAEHFERDTVSHSRYLFARKGLRKLIKRCQNQATTDHFVNTEKVKNYKPRKYWQQIRQSKKSDQKLYTINNKTDTTEITNEFKEHFDNILNTPRVPEIDNISSNADLRSFLTNLEQQEDELFHVTEEDIRKAISSLNNNKTFDPHNIKAEHYKNASTKLYERLATTTNKILKNQGLPTELSISVIIPLVKSFRKSLHGGNNFRVIGLTPITTKIIEKTILNKCPKVKQHNHMQFGFAENSSTIHAELFIKETIQKYNSEHTPIYLCSLDAEKAFDTFNWLKLFTTTFKTNCTKSCH